MLFLFDEEYDGSDLGIHHLRQFGKVVSDEIVKSLCIVSPIRVYALFKAQLLEANSFKKI
jgi:hypothetical protein